MDQDHILNTRRPWTGAEDRLLARARTGKSPMKPGGAHARRERRRQLGVLPFIYHPKRWTVAEESALGAQSDYVVAKRFKRTRTSVRAKSLHIPVFEKKYREAVCDKRNQMKMPYLNPRYDWWTESELKLLDQLLDDEVARRTGRSVNAIQLKRFKLRAGS